MCGRQLHRGAHDARKGKAAVVEKLDRGYRIGHRTQKMVGPAELVLLGNQSGAPA